MTVDNGLYQPTTAARSRLLAAAGAVLLTISLLNGCQQSEQSDADLVEQSRSAIDSGDIPSALIALKNAIQKNPRNAEARWLLGDLYLKIDDWKGATKELGKAHELGVPLPQLAVNLSEAMLMNGEYKEVLIEIPETAANNDADRSSILVVHGDALALLNDPEAAAESYLKASEISPTERLPWLGLARLYLFTNELDKAEESVSKAVKLAPEDTQTVELRADLLRRQQEHFQALQLYLQILEEDPDHAAATAGAGWSLYYLGKLDEAQEYATRVQTVPTYERDSALLLASIRLQQDNADKALSTLQGMSATESPSTLEQYLTASVHFKLGQFEQSEYLLTRLLKRQPSFTPARLILSSIYLDTERPEKSIAILPKSADHDPASIAANTQLTMAYLQLGDPLAAVGALRRIALTNSPAAESASDVIALVEAGETHRALKTITEPAQPIADTIPAEAEPIVDLLRAGKLEEAIVAAESLAAKRPDDPTADNLAALAYREQGDIKRARTAFERALAKAPGDPAAATGLASLAVQAGDDQAAIGYYQMVLDRDPKYAPIILLMAATERRLGLIERSENRLLALINEKPSSAPPRVLLAQIYLEQNEAQQALELLEELRSFSSAGNGAGVLTELGRAQYQLGRYQAATETLGRVTTAQPDNHRALYLLAKAYRASGDLGAYRASLERVLDLTPGHLPTQLRLVRLGLSQQDPVLAQQWLDPLVQSNPELTDVLTAQAGLALLNQEPAKAVDYLKRALAQHPDSRLVRNLAAAQLRANDAVDAAQTLTLWLREHPADSQARSMLASILLMTGHPAESIETLKEVVKHAPDNAGALNNLALMTWKTDPEKAKKYAERAVVATNDNPLALDTLGVVLLKTGDPRGAAQAFGQALAKAPENPSFALHKATALIEIGDNGEAERLLAAITSSDLEFEEREHAEFLLKTLRTQTSAIENPPEAPAGE